MVIIPSWLVLCSLTLPALVLCIVLIVFIMTVLHTVYTMLRHNRYVNHFNEYTRADECSTYIPLLVSVFCVTAGTIAGISAQHAVFIPWYVLMNAFAVLYVVYVIDYYNLKRKGMLG